ncbi:MAG: hypothetical protein ACTHMG_10605 [Sphingomonas sp.]
MVRPLAFLIVAAALPLTACDKSPGTTISLNTSDHDGVSMSDNGQTGEVALNVPGFSGKLKLPKLHLDGDNVDFNGVHLYPGSKVTGMNVDAANDDGVVHIAFDSPADPAAVRGWFNDKLSDAGFTLHQEGTGLAGTTDEKKAFRLELQPAGDGKSHGRITVS